MLEGLDRKVRKQYCEALGLAFGDYDSLNLMTRGQLGIRLSKISQPAPMDEVVLSLVEWAEENGQLDDLIAGALAERPKNPWLLELAPLLVLTGTGEPSPQLQGIVLKNNALMDFGKWRGRMETIENSVCRFEVTVQDTGAIQGVGSGFLVAPDLVLTNCHVIDDLFQAGAIAPAVRLAARTDTSGTPLPAEPVALSGGREAWTVGSSPVEELDYALVRLPSPSTFPPLPQPQPYSFRQGDIYFILQHPAGALLQIGTGGFVSQASSPPRVNYSNNTLEGSSGSPVFTQNWQPVALHRAGTIGFNIGVPLTAIVDHARAAGTWPA